jgi:hypothetical protein
MNNTVCQKDVIHGSWSMNHSIHSANLRIVSHNLRTSLTNEITFRDFIKTSLDYATASHAFKGLYILNA